MLDERLISALLQQDPVLFGESSGRGRLLHRKAFAPFLPAFLRDNPTKIRQLESDFKQQQTNLARTSRQALEQELTSIENWHPGLACYWDVGEILSETEDVLRRSEPTINTLLGTYRCLYLMTVLSSWWQALDY